MLAFDIWLAVLKNKYLKQNSSPFTNPWCPPPKMVIKEILLMALALLKTQICPLVKKHPFYLRIIDQNNFPCKKVAF